MTVKVLVQYKVFGDNDYTYIESFEVQYSSNVILRLDYCWRLQVVKALAKRCLPIIEIKDLNIEIIKD